MLEGVIGPQREAVTHAGGPLVVLGGPGAGKTRVIESRFLWLVSEGVEPGRIAVVCPSAAGADLLRGRLESELMQGYDELVAETPLSLAARLLGGADALGAGDRLAMLIERIDELSIRHHDFGGSANTLIGSFVRRIDRLKAELIGADEYAAWAAGADPVEQEFAEVYRTHERMLAEASARDHGDLLRDALRLIESRPRVAERFEHVLVDDGQEFDLAATRLVRASAADGLAVAGDPDHAVRQFRGAGAARMASWAENGARVVALRDGYRCPPAVTLAARVVHGDAAVEPLGEIGGKVEFWRCASERAQAQSVAADVERLISRDGRARGRCSRAGAVYRARGPGGRGRARGASGPAPARRRGGVLPARRDP